MLLPALMITCTHAKIHFEQEKALNSESTQRRADEEHEQDLNVSQIPRHRGSVQGLAGSGTNSPSRRWMRIHRETRSEGVVRKIPPDDAGTGKDVMRIPNTHAHECPIMPAGCAYIEDREVQGSSRPHPRPRMPHQRREFLEFRYCLQGETPERR